jgi:uracil-DNA glycosylase
MIPFTETAEFQDWLAELAAMPSTPTVENLYADTNHGKVRLANLREYFRRMALLHPELILIGEAPGYQGTRRTGVPFGSEHIITGGMPEVGFFANTQGFERAFNERIYKEPTSTIMWRTISAYEKLPLLWAVYPLHPHQPGNIESNRTPTRKEVGAMKDHLVKLLQITGVKTVLALGNTAKATLDDLNIPAQKLRHPARGGGPVFRKQLDMLRNSDNGFNV